jgi:hypothetical protein
MPPSLSLARRPGAALSAPLWRLSLWMLSLPLLLAGCSGTPFGESLSRSFSGSATPAGPQPASAPASSGSAPRPTPAGGSIPAARPSPAGGKPPAAAAVRPGSGAAPPAATTTPAAPTTTAAPAIPAPPATPAPYRITILLPQADPAAPAEVVTRALRAAGVPFEVETIQRTAAGQQARPAPPAVRPAPPPR